jgi:hypothetical protein
MLARVELNAIESRIFMIPSGSMAVIHAIYFANTTSALRRVRLNLLVSGETSSTANAMFHDVAIAPNGTLVDATRFRMEEGQRLVGLADAAGVTVTIHGTMA